MKRFCTLHGFWLTYSFTQILPVAVVCRFLSKLACRLFTSYLQYDYDYQPEKSLTNVFYTYPTYLHLIKFINANSVPLPELIIQIRMPIIFFYGVKILKIIKYVTDTIYTPVFDGTWGIFCNDINYYIIFCLLRFIESKIVLADSYRFSSS